MNTDPITQDEMIQMFGESMPIEAVELVWNSDGSKTCGQIRNELREIAKSKAADVLQELVGTISEMALRATTEIEDPEAQWRLGYQQACSDIVLLICRTANKRRSTSVTNGVRGGE